MIYKVEILPAAWEDLKRIEDWYVLQSDVETALKVSERRNGTVRAFSGFRLFDAG